MKARLFTAFVLAIGVSLLAIVLGLPVVAHSPGIQTTICAAAGVPIPDNRGLSDTVTRFSDGVSTEAITWLQVHPTTSPSERRYHAMACDSARGRIVLFGGYDEAGVNHQLGDTWEWDGSNWVQQFPSTSPQARHGHTMTYDSARARVVLFGGWDDNNLLGDTWEWDGSNWTQRFPSTSPLARYNHAVAYDSTREVIVLFGGYDRNSPLGDTWEWNGTNWLQRLPAASPATRWSHAMAYDGVRGRVVLFGGWNGSSLVNDTWEWDGSNWIQRFPSTSPSARYVCVMTYDSTREVVVLFSGYNGSAWPNDTWEWDGFNWIQRFPVVSPPELRGTRMTYDENRQRTVLFGGTVANDTWEYRSVRLQISPAARVIWPNYTTTFSVSAEGVPLPLTLMVPTLPQGMSGQFYPSAIITPPAESTLVLTTSTTTPHGVYPITLYGRGESLTATVQVTLAIVAAPDFGLMPTPVSWMVYPGSVVTYSVALTASATYTAPVAMELSGLPTGVAGVFSPNSASPPATVGLQLTAASSAVAGTYSLVITGTGTVFSGTTAMPLVHTVPVTLSVLPSGITSTISPGLRAIYQCQSTVYTITFGATPGLTQPVTLTVDGLSGTDVALEPNPVPLGGAAILAVTTKLDTWPRTYLFTATATSSGLTSTASATLIVLPANITITVSPGSRTIYRGQSTSYGVHLAATPGFTLPATLAAGQLPGGTSYSFAPPAVSPGGSATLFVTPTAATPLGAYPLAITSTAGSLVRTAHATLEVRHSLKLGWKGLLRF
ncbi:MAG: hypothetical protein KKA73_13625 [Chloroflexi bacterium]|nr:hypothetical protein [Chloroflexota bacterium]